MFKQRGRTFIGPLEWADAWARDEYQARRESGVCWKTKSCGKPAVKAGLCEHHAEIVSEQRRAAARRRYMEAKASGRCTWDGCKKRQIDGILFCEEHAVARRTSGMDHKRKHREKVRKQQRAQKRRVRREREERGVCVKCNQPAVTRTLCVAHRAENNARAAANRRASGVVPRKAYTCKLCRQPGHDSRTCPNVAGGTDMLDIGEIATRGLGQWTA